MDAVKAANFLCGVVASMEKLKTSENLGENIY